MAGGTFKLQNKTRPGAYINFKGVAKPLSSLGIRGVVTMPVAMSWGDEVTELLSTDLIDGKSLPKIGYTAFEEQSQIFREALKNAYKAIIYRLDTGGTKASAALTPLTATAKYAGIVGNEIAVRVVANGENFDVITLFRDIERNRQTVKTVAELVPNDYVVFSGTGDVVANAGVTLAGGENGTVNEVTYSTYLNKIKAYKWNTMGIPQDVPAVNSNIITFITNMRENLGRKVQAVLYDADADYEGIITVNQGYKTTTETVSPTTFVAYVAGLTAGSDVNASNTYHAINEAVSIVYPEGVTPYGDEEIEEALKAGKMVLSTRQDGVVVIEQDINTLHTFTPDKGYTFSKNRVIRTLDEINNSIALLFERSYIGKVDNNDDGRNVFKADVIAYLNMLQDISAIQNFDSTTDIQVYAGEAIDAVVVDLATQPVDSMEKLYMTVMVG
ncbi:MAG: phage tail sheath family protein [Tissierellaceae bacterium]|nr:phage tail sheath family protein [Tissierellaceae bacterium]